MSICTCPLPCAACPPTNPRPVNGALYAPAVVAMAPAQRVPEPTGTPIRPSAHVHRCPKCDGLERCDAACATWTDLPPFLGMRRGAEKRCIACRLAKPTAEPRTSRAGAEPRTSRAGALSGILDNLVTILLAHGWPHWEIAHALDGARDNVKRG